LNVGLPSVELGVLLQVIVSCACSTYTPGCGWFNLDGLYSLQLAVDKY